MKTNISTFCKKCVIKRIFQSFFLLSFLGTTMAQYSTVVLKEKTLNNLVPYYDKAIPDPTILPSVDVSAALAEDFRLGIEPNRFGIKIASTVNRDNGELKSYGKKMVWRKAFYAKGAKTLNFQFEKFNLPLSAQMFIYNSEGSMLIGPIDYSQIHQNKFSSDIIAGQEAIIHIVLDQDDLPKFSIEISNVIFGFKHFESISSGHSRDYEDSQACEIDVRCSVGAGFSDQRDAVMLIIVDGIRTCSGSLINSACQELEGFVLTANHCLDGASGHLDWVFRFNYDSPNPSIGNDCHGDEPTIWLSYSGADVIANWSTSDFALLDLSNSVIGQPTLALSGWNNATSLSTQFLAAIHHPEGDVKKIALDDDALGTSNANFWRVAQFDNGLVEYVSSGCPLLDANARIIGQLHGGDGNIGCSGDGGLVDNNDFGRLSVSFPGGGSSTNRLSDWLGSGTTTNAIRSPYISNLGGDAPLCTTNETYTLNNLISGRSATWAVTPTNLFATTSGASTSGSGTSAVLRAASGSVHGLGTLTFTISAGQDCNTIPVIKHIWVGIPGSELDGDGELCTSEYGIVNVILPSLYEADMGVSSTSWSYTGPISYFSNSPAYARFRSTIAGSGSIYATVTNSCGSAILSFPYTYDDCERNPEVTTSVYPNPTNGNIFLTLSSTNQKADFLSSDYQGSIYVYDKFGHIVLSDKLTSDQQEINTSGLSTGLYILELKVKGFSTKCKFMVYK